MPGNRSSTRADRDVQVGLDDAAAVQVRVGGSQRLRHRLGEDGRAQAGADRLVQGGGLLHLADQSRLQAQAGEGIVDQLPLGAQGPRQDQIAAGQLLERDGRRGAVGAGQRHQHHRLPRDPVEVHAMGAALVVVQHRHVGPLVHDRIIGALELCCRRGEMLLIQNRRVDWDTHTIGIPGQTTKDKENRRIPFDPEGRLTAILRRRVSGTSRRR